MTSNVNGVCFFLFTVNVNDHSTFAFSFANYYILSKGSPRDIFVKALADAEFLHSQTTIEQVVIVTGSRFKFFAETPTMLVVDWLSLSYDQWNLFTSQ